jgi:O-methyltransferase involved in polyketide biosynthesis
MKLPKSLRWIEVDFPTLLAHKERKLPSSDAPISLRRIPADLSDRKPRQELFAQIAAQSKSILVLTEGVLPYLTEEEVGSLAEDLHAEKNIGFWIAECFSSQSYRYFKNRKRMRRMKNAPFRFFPADWFDFFKRRGWVAKEERYYVEESIGLNRPIPLPWWAKIFTLFMSKTNAQRHQPKMGYVIYAPVR